MSILTQVLISNCNFEIAFSSYPKPTQSGLYYQLPSPPITKQPLKDIAGNTNKHDQYLEVWTHFEVYLTPIIVYGSNVDWTRTNHGPWHGSSQGTSINTINT